MRINGNYQVQGQLSSPQLIVGSFVGTSITSGSYMFPYPIGTPGSNLSVVVDTSGNRVLAFVTGEDVSNLVYNPLTPSDWYPVVPSEAAQALDILAHNVKFLNLYAEDLLSTETLNSFVLVPNTSGGVTWQSLSTLYLPNYYTKAQTDSISGSLQVEINNLNSEVASLSANLGSKTFISLSDVPNSYTSHANDFVTVNNSETGLSFTSLLSGSISCNTIVQSYTVFNSKLTSNSLPIVSLTIPTSAETQYVVTPTNIRSGAFDVVLSDIPTVPGYVINWLSFNNV